MSETCSLCGGPPQDAIGHDLPAMSTTRTGFCLCGACAVAAISPTRQGSRGTGAAPSGNSFTDQVADAIERAQRGEPSSGATPTASFTGDAFTTAIASAVEQLRAEGFDPDAPTSVVHYPLQRGA